jgi:hypothetical protein
MPFQEGILVSTISAQAGANFSASQFFAVALGVDSAAGANPVPGVQMNLATATGQIFAGILQDNPVAGQAGSIQTSGISLAVIALSIPVTAGALLYINSSGQLTTSTGTSATAIAQAMETCSSNASLNPIISVRILQMNVAL